MLNKNNAKFEITAVNPDQFPSDNLPEIVFVGRSNVGKSSIINTLLNRKNLARVGNTPGKTRNINYFNIDEKIFFVDLPGYGYASVSKQERTNWSQAIEKYLNLRTEIKLVIFLIDIRHDPSEYDKIMFDWILNKGINFIVVGSKKDKIPRSKIDTRIKQLKQSLSNISSFNIIPYSSLKKQGIDEVWSEIDKVIEV